MEKIEPTFENLTYCGRMLPELSHDELKDAIVQLYKEYDRMFELYKQASKSTCDMMKAVIEYKKQQA